MERKRSFIMRLFTTLFALLLAILTVAGFGIYVYARQVVGEEFIRLNQANLQQVASNTGSALMEALTLGKQIAVNSRLLALSELPQEEARKEAQSILNDLVTEYNATHTNNRSLMDVFVLGFACLGVQLGDRLRRGTLCRSSLCSAPCRRKRTGVAAHPVQ